MLTNVILTSLFTLGIYSITRTDKLLSFIRVLAVNRNNDNRFMLSNVFCECPVCMASLYGMLSYAFFYETTITEHAYVALALGYLIVVTTILEVVSTGIAKTAAEWVSKLLYISFVICTCCFILQPVCLVYLILIAGSNAALDTALQGFISIARIADNSEDSVAVLASGIDAIKEKLD